MLKRKTEQKRKVANIKKSINLYVKSQLLESTRTSDFFFTVRGTSQQGESDTKFVVECHIS